MSNRYFILQHIAVQGKAELAVVHSLMGEDEAEATERFKAWMEEVAITKQSFLVKVLGSGLMEVEMKVVFREEGNG